MDGIELASIDLVLTDLPYGTTANRWDEVIPMDRLWPAWKRLLRGKTSPVVLFTQQPFTSTVAASNLRELRTEWIWEKANATGFLNANRYPLKQHENVLVFSEKMPRYFPQKSSGHLNYKLGKGGWSSNYGKFITQKSECVDGTRFPTTMLRYKHDRGFGVKRTLHPTQKPVALLEYLIRTYTLPGMTVLDCTMGSGSTGVAALNAERSFVGIEKDADYFEVARQRVVMSEMN